MRAETNARPPAVTRATTPPGPTWRWGPRYRFRRAWCERHADRRVVVHEYAFDIAARAGGADSGEERAS